jgi:UPF0755 protein
MPPKRTGESSEPCGGNHLNASKPASRVGRIVFASVGFLILLLAIGLISSLIILSNLDKPTGTISDEGLLFTVGKGESGISIARRLVDGGAIHSDLLLRFMMKAMSLEHDLKAGEYRISATMRSSDILKMIADGRQVLIRLVIPEGATLRQVAQIAEIAEIADKKTFLEASNNPVFLKELGIEGPSTAGYLFPDTYLLPRNAGAENLIRLMVNTFKERLAKTIPESGGESVETARQRLILASIVEREYRVAKEAPIMAGVFWNRLRIGMALQSCATVVYVITERLGKPHPSRLFDRDLIIPDPFNTYLHSGLPPEPICNPGLTALTASYRPASSRFLYFRLVNETSGEHYFSETLDEHIKASSLAVKPGSR